MGSYSGHRGELGHRASHGSGFGAGWAACVGISYLNQAEQSAILAEEMWAAGSRVLVLSAGAGLQEDAAEFVGRFIAKAGGIDILVNSVGASPLGRSDTVSPEVWGHTLRLPVSAPFWSRRISAPVMMWH